MTVRLLRRMLATLALTALVPCVAATQAGCDTEDVSTVLQAPRMAARDARAVWLDRRSIRWPGIDASGRFRLLASARGQVQARVGRRPLGMDTTLALSVRPSPAAANPRFRWVGAGVELTLDGAELNRLPALLRGQLVLVQEDAKGRVGHATELQIAGALDDEYAAAARLPDLGATLANGRTRFRLWAPTAVHVALCLYPPRGPAMPLPMRRDPATGAWALERAGDLSGRAYAYLVDVYVRGVGLVRNRVTDPYSLSLTTDSQRSVVEHLDDPRLAPPGWRDGPRPPPLAAQTDMVVYELHLRDFSASDASVPAAHRGKYLAFTDTGSRGMQHLAALAAAGVTDIHLMPVFDFSSVPESGCDTPDIAGLHAAPDSARQQAAAVAAAATDCFNWGYDPWHYAAPEGSYATDAADGAVRIVEFRRMVQALHAAGLRVGMDLVYNHTSASGETPTSVLDRIVPGYYQRLDASGSVEHSTCCANTATENAMMAKLMIDSAVVWARDYRIDSFRFDLMGHQPRTAMLALQAAVDAAAGRHVNLIGEGWNFGEVADGARFVQAAQGRLDGTGIATFSDRGRDALRGGSAGDDGVDQVLHQGWINGQFYDPNSMAVGHASRADLLHSADLVRVALAGTIRDYRLRSADGRTLPLAEIAYAGQGAGYASEPDEVVNYVENHDNQTLFDADAFKLPLATSAEDRARVQILGAAVVAFSQGVAYFDAGIETLRSKSMDRNSFDSGDWFNRLDWSFSDNHFGSGLPPEHDNGHSWPLMRPLLADAAIRPTPAQIAWTRDAFADLLRIRASSTLFRLRTTADIERRLRFFDTGPDQLPTVIVGDLDGTGYPGAGFAEIVYLINVDKVARTVTVDALKHEHFVLHPVLAGAGAADRRAASARYDAASGAFTVPPRTAVVFVRYPDPSAPGLDPVSER